MVLIFIKTPEGQTISLDVEYDATVKYLKKLVSRYLEISSKHQKLLFGGQLLQDEQTLDTYNITKECALQLVLPARRKPNGSNSLSSTPCLSPIKPRRKRNAANDYSNTISPYLQFGDLILVQLIEAKELKKCDFWRQSSDPYVILSVGGFSTKSKIIRKNTNPKWNEMFCFVVDSAPNAGTRNLKNDKRTNVSKPKHNRHAKRERDKQRKRKEKQHAKDLAAGSTDDDAGMAFLGDSNPQAQGGGLVPMHQGGGDAGRGGHPSHKEHDTSLSFLVFDHDRFTPDAFMGSTEICASRIPYDNIVDLWMPLSHIETGHLHVRIRKCSLSSPMHRSIVFKLMALERSLTISDLERNQISLDQLVGNEAWIHGQDNLSNPALEHLVSVLLLDDNSRTSQQPQPQPNGLPTQPTQQMVNQADEHLWKSNSLRRIQSILSSQHMLPTKGNPTRYVWFSGLSGNHRALFALIKQYVVPKRVYWHSKGASTQGAFALVEFKTIRDAVFVFITFQHKKFKHARILLGFGRRLIYDRRFLHKVEMAGFLSLYHAKANKWQLCWCFLRAGRLMCFQNLQCDAPLVSVNLCGAMLCCASLKSLEIVEKDGDSYFVYNHVAHEMSHWTHALRRSCDTKELDEIESDEKYNDDELDVDVTSEKDILLECGKCHALRPLSAQLSPDSAPYFCCVGCLRSDIVAQLSVDAPDLEYLSTHYSIQDLMEVLEKGELAAFLDLKLSELLESTEHFITCPHCGSQWEFEAGGVDDAPDFSREVGVNNQLLSEEAQRHYLSHRVCCRQCAHTFCRGCKREPYHSGFNCAMYEVYLNADKCRFCATALMPGGIGLDPPSPALALVCNNAICLEKRALSCRHTLPCGCPCGGTLGGCAEGKHCMSCLEPECEGRSLHCTQAKDDYCAICFTEELSEAPCIELDCQHIFHFSCLVARLDMKQYYDSPAVNLNHARCPLCSERISVSHSPLLDAQLRPIQALQRELEVQCLVQLKEEGELEIPDKTMTYALKRYAFYYCNICKTPYHGGMAQCRDVAAGLNSSDFVCSPCSGIGREKCKVHGKDYMVYKCKFCCAVATYFCWGNTHFCVDCHKRQENHDFMTTKAKKDLMQCPGPEKCPLGIEHPPNGEEFSIGCSLCRGTEFFVQTTNDNPPQVDALLVEDEEEEKRN